MTKPLKKFIWLAVVLFVAIIVIAILNEGTLRSIGNALIAWVTGALGVPSVTLF